MNISGPASIRISIAVVVTNVLNSLSASVNNTVFGAIFDPTLGSIPTDNWTPTQRNVPILSPTVVPILGSIDESISNDTDNSTSATTDNWITIWWLICLLIDCPIIDCIIGVASISILIDEVDGVVNASYLVLFVFSFFFYITSINLLLFACYFKMRKKRNKNFFPFCLFSFSLFLWLIIICFLF